MGGGGRGRGRGGGGQRFHRGKANQMLAPGKTGFLFTTTTGPVDRSKREIEALLERFVTPTNGDWPTAEEEEEKTADSVTDAQQSNGDAAPPPTATSSAVPSSSLASMLMAELDEIRGEAFDPNRLCVVGAENDGSDPNTGGGRGRGRGGGDGGRGGRGGKRRMGTGDHWQLLETNCKGYLFYQLDRPPEAEEEEDSEGSASSSEEEEEGRKRARENEDESDDDITPTTAAEKKIASEDATADGTPSTAVTTTTNDTSATTNEVGAGDGGQKKGNTLTEAEVLRRTLHRFRINPNVDSVSEAVMSHLMSSPEVVARFTFKMIPVVATCNPSLAFIIPLVQQLASELQVPQGRSLLKFSVSLFIRNNTTIEKEKAAWKLKVEQSLPVSKFVSVKPDGADVMFTIAVVHSTCCIGLSRNFCHRFEYNLNRISQSALKLESHTTTKPTTASSKIDDDAKIG